MRGGGLFFVLVAAPVAVGAVGAPAGPAGMAEGGGGGWNALAAAAGPAVAALADAAVFAAGYLALAAAVHVAVYRAFAGRGSGGGGAEGKGRGERGGRRDPALALAAFDLASLVQFAAWVPLGMGALGLGPAALFLIPTVHELYDAVYVSLVHRRRFTRAYRAFVLQHHAFSLVSRGMLAVLFIALMPAGEITPLFRGCLLYYCCSVFLVAPGALEERLFGRCGGRGRGRPGGRAQFRLAMFALARVSHLAVASWLVARSLAAGAEGSGGEVVACALALCYIVNEWHSVTHGLPRLRGAGPCFGARGVGMGAGEGLASPARAGRAYFPAAVGPEHYRGWRARVHAWAMWTQSVRLRLLYRVRVSGAEHIPERGRTAFIIASNHTSTLDPPVVSHVMGRRPIACMAKSELFASPWTGLLYNWLGAFPVDRARPRPSTIRTARLALASGRWAVGIFPEGAFGGAGRLGPMKDGVGLLAHLTGAPVLPVAVVRSGRAGRTIAVHVGPMVASEGRTAEQIGAAVRQAITALHAGAVAEAAVHGELYAMAEPA